MKKINSTSRVIQKGNIRYWGRGIEAEDICHLKWQLDELQKEQGKGGKNMQGKKMRRGELKEYRADFFRSVGLIYAFTPSLAYKHPWNEEPVLLSLLCSPVSTTLGKSAWQQHLRAAGALSRRWFSKGELSHGVPCSLPAVPEAAAAARWEMSSGLCPNLLCRAKPSANTREHHALSHCAELHSVHSPWLALLKKSSCFLLWRDE